MAYMDIRPYKSPLGGHMEVRYAPMKASETFEGGELIYINSSGEALTAPKDGTQTLLGESAIGTGVIFGVAVNGPGTAAVAATPKSRAWIDPSTGTTYATGAQIGYYTTGPGKLFISQFLVAGGASGAATTVSGADRGIVYEITYESASTPDAGWGVELTAGVVATDLLARVVDILDVNYKRLSATAATGVYAVFEILTSVS